MKKAIKILKNPIFTFVLGMILFGSMGVVYGINVASEDVSYDKSTSASYGATKTNVKEAIDELYARSVYTELSGTKKCISRK